MYRSFFGSILAGRMALAAMGMDEKVRRWSQKFHSRALIFFDKFHSRALTFFYVMWLGVTKVSFKFHLRHLGATSSSQNLGGVVLTNGFINEDILFCILQRNRRSSFRSIFKLTELKSVPESGNYSARRGNYSARRVGPRTCKESWRGYGEKLGEHAFEKNFCHALVEFLGCLPTQSLAMVLGIGG